MIDSITHCLFYDMDKDAHEVDPKELKLLDVHVGATLTDSLVALTLTLEPFNIDPTSEEPEEMVICPAIIDVMTASLTFWMSPESRLSSHEFQTKQSASYLTVVNEVMCVAENSYELFMMKAMSNPNFTLQ